MIVLESWRFDTMNEVVSPHMHALSRRSSVFLQHLSSGNSTPHGIFGLFYGIHPTYWAEVKASSAAIDTPRPHRRPEGPGLSSPATPLM